MCIIIHRHTPHTRATPEYIMRLRGKNDGANARESTPFEGVFEVRGHGGVGVCDFEGGDSGER